MRSQRGFTYIGLLFAIAIVGIGLAAVGVVWSTQIRREKEADLLFAGDQIRAAIGHYYSEAPSGVHSYPPSLADLLEDHRWPQVHRHLRRIYRDPITGGGDWQLLVAPEGGVMGVATASQLTPIKRANFTREDAAFEQADRYSDWQFIYMPRGIRRNTAQGVASTVSGSR
jgi:type II secretory pathway pseudopilin PulG